MNLTEMMLTERQLEAGFKLTEAEHQVYLRRGGEVVPVISSSMATAELLRMTLKEKHREAGFELTEAEHQVYLRRRGEVVATFSSRVPPELLRAVVDCLLAGA